MTRKPSTKKGHLAPWTVAVDRDSKVDYALEGSLLVVQVLQDIGSMSGVPHLKEAAGIALSILTIVRDVRNRNQDFTDLASDACGLVYTIVLECQNMVKEGQQVSERVQGHIVLLAGNLSEIEKFAQRRLNRGKLKKIIYHSKDLDQIARYRILLRQSLDIFDIQSNISIQENLRRILENIETQREELKADRARQEEEKKHAEDLASRLEVMRIQEEDREAERLRVQREVEDDQRRKREMSQERKKNQEREEWRRARKDLEEEEKSKEAQRDRLSPEQDEIRQDRRKRTPSPRPDPNHPFHLAHPGYPPPTYPSPYPYPAYPLSPYNVASPMLSPGGISIGSVSGSGISLGGGPVNVTNWNSGNVSHTVIKNSMNSNVPPRRKSPRRAYEQESDDD